MGYRTPWFSCWRCWWFYRTATIDGPTIDWAGGYDLPATEALRFHVELRQYPDWLTYPNSDIFRDGQ